MMSRYGRIALGCLILWLSLPLQLNAVGTVSVATYSAGTTVTRYTISWTSNASGAVSGNTSAMAGIARGFLMQIRFVPGTGGSQPTDLYDVTLVDAQGIDYLSGGGANLSNSAGLMSPWNPRLFIDPDTDLDLVVANAGNAKSGTITLWVQR